MNRAAMAWPVGVLAGGAMAKSITGLGAIPGGDYSMANGISADGRIVVGRSGTSIVSFSGRAFRWTNEGGMVNLGVGSQPGGLESAAFAASADGGVVVGNRDSRAFRWTGAGGFVELTPINTIVGAGAAAVSGDGSVVVGSGGNAASATVAYRWTSTTGMVALPFPAGPWTEGRGLGVSADASTIVGWVRGSDLLTHAFRWTGGGSVRLPEPPGTRQSIAHAASADGSVIVGYIENGQLGRPARWTGSGPTMLDMLHGAEIGEVFAVSADGSVLVGRFFFPTTEQRAFLWTTALGVVDLNVYLPSRGIDLAGWTLQSATAVSGDGRIITGTGIHENSTEAWLVTIPPCGSADFNCDGDVGTDADIEAFFRCLAGTCPSSPCAGTGDFNGDGDVGTDADIEAFFRVLAGGNC